MQSASGTVNAVTGGKPCAARAAVGLPPLTEKVLCRTVDGILRTGELPRPDVMKKTWKERNICCCGEGITFSGKDTRG